MTGDGAVLHLGGSITDHHHVGDATTPRSILVLPARVPSAQATRQFAAQFSAALDI